MEQQEWEKIDYKKIIQDLYGSYKSDKKTLPDIPHNYQFMRRVLTFPSPSQYAEKQVYGRFFHWINDRKKIIRIINRPEIDRMKGIYNRAIQKHQSHIGQLMIKLRVSQDNDGMLGQQIAQHTKAIDAFQATIDLCNESVDFNHITDIPDRFYDETDPRVTLTYAFDENYVVGDANYGTAENNLSDYKIFMRNFLHSSPYIRYIEIDPTSSKHKPAVYVTLRKDLNSNLNGFVPLESMLKNQPTQMVIETGHSFDKFKDIAIHEWGHSCGLSHCFHNYHSHESPNTQEISQFTRYINASIDSSNLAYSNDLRRVYNQTVRALTDTLMTALYSKQDPYIDGVTFIFEPTEGHDHVITTSIPLASGTQVIFSGRCSGLTLDNIPNGDKTNLDFSAVPAFTKEQMETYKKNYKRDKDALPFVNGVSAYLGINGSITFNTYLPEYAVFVAEGSEQNALLSWDKTVSTSCNLINLEGIKGSKINDHFECPVYIKNTIFYPATGNDYIKFGGGDKNELHIGKDEGQDIVNFERGSGTVFLDYTADELKAYTYQGALYLMKTSDKSKKPHGLCIEDYFEKPNAVDKSNVPTPVKEKLKIQTNCGHELTFIRQDLPVIPLSMWR